jgi:hypothetical protein
LSKLKVWKVPQKFSLRLPSRVLIQRYCGKIIAYPVTSALWWLLAVVKAGKHAKPSERT